MNRVATLAAAVLHQFAVDDNFGAKPVCRGKQVDIHRIHLIMQQYLDAVFVASAAAACAAAAGFATAVTIPTTLLSGRGGPLGIALATLLLAVSEISRTMLLPVIV